MFEPRKRKLVVKYADEIKDDTDQEKKKKPRTRGGDSSSGDSFTEKEVRGVHRGLMKYGTSAERLDLVIQESGTKKGSSPSFFFLKFILNFLSIQFNHLWLIIVTI